ncbi:ABC transporter B family member 5, putative [Plasmodium sp. gorilla clade G1]|nr:ABC transporter B family member 5, putative [Plasmodium sp. gorilla clade G1]
MGNSLSLCLLRETSKDVFRYFESLYMKYFKSYNYINYITLKYNKKDDKMHRKKVITCADINEGPKNNRIKKENYIFRAFLDMTKHEKTLLSLAMVFLIINAYTNINYPRIMGECIEASNHMNNNIFNNIHNNNNDNIFNSNIFPSNDNVIYNTFCNINICNNVINFFFDKISFIKNYFVDRNIIKTIIFYFPYFICGGIASYMRIYFTNQCIKNIEIRLKKQVHDKILMNNEEEFKEYKTSDYLVNCTFIEIKYSAKELITCITQTFRYMNSVVGGLISMSCISLYLTKLCLFIIPIYGLSVLCLLKSLKRIKIETTTMEEKQIARFSDSLQKKNIISLFGNESYEHRYFCKQLHVLNNLYDKYITCESIFYSFLNIGTNVVICTILCLGRLELTTQHITHGQLVSFIVYSTMLGLGVGGMLKLKKDINLLQISLQKIYEILDLTKSETQTEINNYEQGKLTIQNKQVDLSKNKQSGNSMGKYKPDNDDDNKEDNKDDSKDYNKDDNKDDSKDYNNDHHNDHHNDHNNDNNNVVMNELPFKYPHKSNYIPNNIKGSIRFENVSFSYNHYDKERKKSVLKNINLEIKASEKVAIIGKSGSGKSTLWKLLTCNFSYEGNIYIDNLNIKNIHNHFLKRNILSVSEQECCIFNRTIYENLIYGLVPLYIKNNNNNNNYYQYLSKCIFQNMNPGNNIHKKILNNIQTTKYNSQCYQKNKHNITSNFITQSYRTQDEDSHNISNHKHIDNTSRNIYQNYYTDFLNSYDEYKLNIINSSINVLCEELDLKQFINSMPHNIHSNIQYNNMSSGQKQRLSIIRSLMKDTPIYIFDEITSFLDEGNIHKLHKLIDLLIPNKTIIYITHSIHILNKMDKIIILDDGKIWAIGTYEQIKNDTLFRDIFSLHKPAV